MTDIAVTTPKDWATDQEVRWCPGCGDYSILTAMRMQLVSHLIVDQRLEARLARAVDSATSR